MTKKSHYFLELDQCKPYTTSNGRDGVIVGFYTKDPMSYVVVVARSAFYERITSVEHLPGDAFVFNAERSFDSFVHRMSGKQVPVKPLGRRHDSSLYLLKDVSDLMCETDEKQLQLQESSKLKVSKTSPLAVLFFELKALGFVDMCAPNVVLVELNHLHMWERVQQHEQY